MQKQQCIYKHKTERTSVTEGASLSTQAGGDEDRPHSCPFTYVAKNNNDLKMFRFSEIK